MHLHPAPLSLVILVATAGLLTAAPPPEDLPARPPRGQKVAPVRDPAAPSQSAEQGGEKAATRVKGCRKPGCTSCIPQVATCKAKWEDKKTKKATFTQKCDFECSRPWEPYHQGTCCEEKTTPCGDVYTKKKLFKTEEESMERVLKYEVVMKPAAPCCEPQPSFCCLGCLGSAFERLFSWCH